MRTPAIAVIPPSPSPGGFFRLGWPAILLLATAQFTAFVDRGVPAVVAPLIKREFGLTDTQIGALQGPAFSVLYAIGLLAAGHWIAGRNPYRVAAVCVVAWTAGSVLFALAPDYAGMTAGRAMLGLGQAAFAPAALALLAIQTDSGRRARALSTFTTGSSIGRSAALFLGGAALAVVAGHGAWGLSPWRAASLVLIAPNLLLASLLLAAGRGHPPGITASRGLGEAGRLTLASPSTLIPVMAAGVACIMGVQAGGAWSASILHRGQQLTPSEAALWAGAVVLICAPIGHLGAGWASASALARRWGAGTLMAVGMTLAALGAIGLAAAVDRAGALAGLGALTIGGGFAAATILIEVQAMTEARLRPQVGAIFLALVSLGGVGLGPVLTGALNDEGFAGANGLAWSLAAVVGASALLVTGIGLAYAGRWRRAAAARI